MTLTIYWKIDPNSLEVFVVFFLIYLEFSAMPSLHQKISDNYIPYTIYVVFTVH